MQTKSQFKNNKNFMKPLVIFLLLILSCAKEEVVRPVGKPVSKWFLTDEMFMFPDAQGLPINHLFFDFSPKIDLSKKTVDALILTKKGSKYNYELDLVSGRKYFTHEYCESEDIWQSYNGKIGNAPLSIGVLPRVLDQLKMPQKVYIFGDQKYISGNSKKDETLTVKVIGGSVEQFCALHPCNIDSKWQSRLVLFAVSLQDPKFNKAKKISDIKKEIDWSEIKAFIENYNGVTRISENYYPAYRLIGKVNPDRALKYALNKGHVFNQSEMKSLRRTCEGLYNTIWMNKENIDREKTNFNKVFYKVYKKYQSSLKTCFDYVRSANITLDSDRHWFFAYLQLFYFLESKNYVYVCDRQSWILNSPGQNGKLLYNQKRELESCSNENINLAFDRGISLASGLLKSETSTIRYIEYDSGARGSHQKIYSWVRTTGKKLMCAKKEKNEIFPEDVSWKKIENTKKVESISIERLNERNN